MLKVIFFIIYTPPLSWLLMNMPAFFYFITQYNKTLTVLSFNDFNPWQILFTTILLLVSVVIALSALYSFYKYRISPLPFVIKKVAIIEDGIYSISRNPMYISLLLSHIGISILLAPILTLFTTPLVYWCLHLEIKREEETLSKLNPKYLAYCERVPRWL